MRHWGPVCAPRFGVRVAIRGWGAGPSPGLSRGPSPFPGPSCGLGSESVFGTEPGSRSRVRVRARAWGSESGAWHGLGERLRHVPQLASGGPWRGHPIVDEQRARPWGQGVAGRSAAALFARPVYFAGAKHTIY